MIIICNRKYNKDNNKQINGYEAGINRRRSHPIMDASLSFSEEGAGSKVFKGKVCFKEGIEGCERDNIRCPER